MKSIQRSFVPFFVLTGFVFSLFLLGGCRQISIDGKLLGEQTGVPAAQYAGTEKEEETKGRSKCYRRVPGANDLCKVVDRNGNDFAQIPLDRNLSVEHLGREYVIPREQLQKVGQNLKLVVDPVDQLGRTIIPVDMGPEVLKDDVIAGAMKKPDGFDVLVMSPSLQIGSIGVIAQDGISKLRAPIAMPAYQQISELVLKDTITKVSFGVSNISIDGVSKTVIGINSSIGAVTTFGAVKVDGGIVTGKVGVTPAQFGM